MGNSDDGIGTPEEYREIIFGLFEKPDPQKPGIGIGMNIVKRIVEIHDGGIQLEPELGEGQK